MEWAYEDEIVADREILSRDLVDAQAHALQILARGILCDALSSIIANSDSPAEKAIMLEIAARLSPRTSLINYGEHDSKVHDADTALKHTHSMCDHNTHIMCATEAA